MGAQEMALACGVVFAALLLAGRWQIARGANQSVANGAVALVLAAIVGNWVVGLLMSR